MRQVYICLVILFFASCNERSSSPERKQVGDKLIETTFINDSTYQGLTKYYSLSNVLESEIEFKNGIKNGYSKNYYPNGHIHDSMTFVNGLAHGYHFVYDSAGHLEYKDFFYQGRKVGGLFYYEQGKIKEYDFVSFDGELLYKAKYDDKESVKEFGGQIINMHTSSKLVDNKKEDVLFLYTLNPPNIAVKYSIGIFDSAQQKRENFKTIPRTPNMFLEINLPKMRNKVGYYVQAEYADSLNKFFKVHITPVAF
jgi:antitoxin component YwqK of YwqJK toxin-antitoxin module